MEEQWLIKTGEAQATLDMPRQRFSELSPHLFALVLAETSQRFPVDYLLGYRDTLEQQQLPDPETADAYARTEQAVGRMSTSRIRYAESLADRSIDDIVPLSAFLALTGLGKQTAIEWRNQDRVRLHTIGAGRNKQLVIPLTEAIRISAWRMPSGLESSTDI